MRRKNKRKNRAAVLLALMAACALFPRVCAGSPAVGDGVVYQIVEPEYYLAFSPAMPEPGKEVTVRLMSKSGQPYTNPVKWILSGAPARNAGKSGANASSCSFTPIGAGSYFVTAEFRDPRGVHVSTTLELVIGPGFAPLDAGAASMPVMAADMFIDIAPAQPRVNQAATFTLRASGGIPEGAEIRWNVAGGAVANKAVSGRQNENFTFVPGNRGAFTVKATLHDARGYAMAEISLGFVPLP